jgi:hypothetical protein
MVPEKIDKKKLSLFNGWFPETKLKTKPLSDWQKKVEETLTGRSKDKNLAYVEDDVFKLTVANDFIDCTALRVMYVSLFGKLPLVRAPVLSDEYLPRYVTVGKEKVQMGEAYDISDTYNALQKEFGGDVYMFLYRCFDAAAPDEIGSQEEDADSNEEDDDYSYDDIAKDYKYHRKGTALFPDTNYLQAYSIVALFKDGLVMKIRNDDCIMQTDPASNVVGRAIKCFKFRQKKRIKRIEYIVHTKKGYSSMKLPIRQQNVDVKTQYNDSLPDEQIRKHLSADRSGIVLIHGDPGTGKTSYIRHLAQTMPRRFVFLDKSMFSYMTDADFIDMLSKMKGSVIVLEDCEDVLKSRSEYNESITTLLNLSDGILGDGFGIKFLCTFNCPVDRIDSAITRKGRLLLKYEVTALEQKKAQKLLNELGLKKKAEGPMTLADIYGADADNGFVKEKPKEKMGF